MDAFVWDERYVTGETMVDDEHRELVRIINEVAELEAQSAEPASLEKVLAWLVQYAVTHFRHEEELMASVACDPRHAREHAAIHREFAQQVVRMRQTVMGKGNLEALLRFLTSWLSYHILGTDQAMARQVRRIREGMRPAEAYEAEKDLVKDPATSTLLDALNALYSVVAERNLALVELNTHLEGLVAERTQALSMANEQLRADQEKLRAAMLTIEITQKKLLESEHRRSEAKQNHLQRLLAQIVEGDPVPTLVIDADHRITHWNQACVAVTGYSADEMVGTSLQWKAFYPNERPIMADLIITGAIEDNFEKFYAGKFRPSRLIPGAFEAEDFFPHCGDGGRWFYFTAAPLRDSDGKIIGAIETLQDVTKRHQAEAELRQHQMQLEQLVEQRTSQLAEANRQLADDIKRREAAEAELQRRYDELQQLNSKLSEAQQQLVQSEKMASIGQLAAGVAHEINNPIGYVQSNIGALEKYLADLMRMLDAYEQAEPAMEAGRRETLQALRHELDLPFLKEDVPMLIGESKEGITRVKKIVQDLKDFSHVDNNQVWQPVDLHQGLDSTINIVANEIKYKADVVKEYGPMPAVECLPSQINQVFMNLLVNAAQAMRESRGKIVIRTGTRGENVWLEFADNGVGMSAEVRQKIFDPFFTTKPVGKGTGLGLSLSYGIIQKHNGRIEVESEPGQGSTFRITLPIQHAEPAANTLETVP